MRRKNIKRIAAAFNLEDPDQLAEYEYVRSKTNCSDYLKRLIRKDMNGGFISAPAVPMERVEEDQDDDLKGLLL